MKRALRDKLLLLVKQRQPAGSAGPSWAFPHTQPEAGESVRAAAERALGQAIGPSSVYFIGNAPMAHLPLESGDQGTVFFMLAQARQAGCWCERLRLRAWQLRCAAGPQGVGRTTLPHTRAPPRRGPTPVPCPRRPAGRMQVVNDPWDVQLRDSFATEHAWVTKAELGDFVQDKRLLELAQRML
jgi:ADP-ribose pyrophosphatase YjhB (NUDIX family)